MSFIFQASEPCPDRREADFAASLPEANPVFYKLTYPQFHKAYTMWVRIFLESRLLVTHKMLE